MARCNKYRALILFLNEKTIIGIVCQSWSALTEPSPISFTIEYGCTQASFNEDLRAKQFVFLLAFKSNKSRGRNNAC